MKIDPGHVAKIKPEKLQEVAAVLVHGSDIGLATETTNSVIDQLDISKDDPFHFVELDEDQLKSGPAALLDEMEALSFDGLKRLVYLRLPLERTATLLQKYLDTIDIGIPRPVVILIKSVPLKASNALRKMAESSKYMYAICCEADSTASLKTVIQQTLHKEGLTIERDALAILLEEFGDDRAYTRNELEKLVLFKSGDSSVITLEDVSDIIAVQNNATLFEIARAVTARKPKEVEKLLNKAFVQGESPVAIVRTVLRFVERQTGPSNILSLLYETEKRLKSTHYPDVAICRQVLARLAGR